MLFILTTLKFNILFSHPLHIDFYIFVLLSSLTLHLLLSFPFDLCLFCLSCILTINNIYHFIGIIEKNGITQCFTDNFYEVTQYMAYFQLFFFFPPYFTLISNKINFIFWLSNNNFHWHNSLFNTLRCKCRELLFNDYKVYDLNTITMT